MIQRHGDRHARAPMYQCRPRGTSQTGARRGSGAAGAGEALAAFFASRLPHSVLTTHADAS